MYTVVGNFSSLLTSACLTYLVAIAYTFIKKKSFENCHIFHVKYSTRAMPFSCRFFCFRIFLKLNFVQRKCCRCRDYSRNLFSFSTPFSFKFIFKFVIIKEEKENDREKIERQLQISELILFQRHNLLKLIFRLHSIDQFLFERKSRQKEKMYVPFTINKNKCVRIYVYFGNSITN